ncbi:hypothetical protein EG329_009358 [Mollisiaceae sp. DMI_Dod_QoI]|nr:hypothetical protein EG329_009358 [Helotiales sp. DMI_Dod_QoI]
MAVASGILAFVDPSSDYTLLKWFTMPTHEGPKAAVAVTFESSKTLLSLYTTMLTTSVGQIWSLVVLFGIALSAKKQRSHNTSIANVIIWNAKASLLEIITLMFGYIGHIPLYALMWTLLAVLGMAASQAVSLLVTRNLIIGLAAPVSNSAMFVPGYSSNSTNPNNTLSYSYRVHEISTPADLRAIGAADNMTTSANVTVGTTSTSINDLGQPIYKVDYSYSLSDVDFGLQNATGLLLTVEGSCFTDYTWYYGTNDTQDILTDVYLTFGSNNTAKTSTADGGPPLAVFLLPPSLPIGSNFSYAIMISSLYRKSFVPGTDPWYATETSSGDSSDAVYIVKRGRPVLNCWQTDIWSYGEKNSSISELGQLGALPNSLVLVFQHFLGLPRIINLGLSLGSTALKSATGVLGDHFDAQSSNLHDDLQRLVLGAYIGTKNTLQETTKFSRQYTDIPNRLNENGTILPGSNAFVIYTSDAAALSIPMLIAVPIITLLLLGLNILLTTNALCYTPPWEYVNALKAAVIYTEIDKDGPNKDCWDLTTPMPIHKGDDTGNGDREDAHVMPGFDPKRKIYRWKRSDRSERGNPRESPSDQNDPVEVNTIPSSLEIHRESPTDEKSRPEAVITPSSSDTPKQEK